MFLTHRSFLIFAIGAALSLNVSAQKKQYTIAEATNGITGALAPKSIKQASWQPGTHNFFQVANKSWVRMDAATGKTDTVLRLQDLNQMLFKKDSLKEIPVISWAGSKIYFKHGKSLYMGTFEGGLRWRPIALPQKAENLTADKYGGYFAYTVDNNLWLIRKGSPLQVSRDTNLNILNGQAVHRNEFGIDNGIFFSPKGNYLAYYRMDQTMVNDYPVIDWSETPAKNTNVKYPMAGGTSHHVRVCVFDPVTEKTVTLNTGDPKDQYLTDVSWSPDEKYIFIALLNRDQNHLWLNQYDAATGEKVRTLFEEMDPKYVEPQHPLSFIPGTDDQFIWWSQRDGYMHLYLYNTAGKLIRQLTKGDWLVNDLLGFNLMQKEILFTSSKESPLEKHGYAVHWKTGKIRRLDNEPGTHNYIANDEGFYVYDVLTATGVPKETRISATDGSTNNLLVKSPDPLADFDRPEIRNIKFKAGDGTALYGKLILPTHFDSTRKYPVVVYLYNGPHVQQVKNGFPESGNLWFEYMAQHGYIVWVMDGRGSSNRGLAFEQATFRKLGTVEMEDQLRGVEYLKTLPYTDPSRFGIHGWSFGGFMTTNIMLSHPGVFQCGVAGGPVMDWKMYEVMYTERYMDTPEQNPEGFEKANLLAKVKNLKGKLLLIHGTQDATVVWQQSIKFLKQCVDNSVQVDYFVYPGYEHNVRGKDRAHLMQKITDYFDLYLRPGGN